MKNLIYVVMGAALMIAACTQKEDPVAVTNDSTTVTTVDSVVTDLTDTDSVEVADTITSAEEV